MIVKKISIILLSGLLSACAVGPDYKQAPEIEMGENYKATTFKDWQQTATDSLNRGAWWERFQDTQLNQLVQELNTHNYQLEQALANYDAALATMKSAQASLFPTVSSGASYTKSGGNQQNSTNAYSATGTIAWEADLWGKVRRQVESKQYSVQASAADIADTKLSLQAQLVKAYIALRMTDEQQKLLNQIVATYEKSVKTNQNRYDQGVAARADVVAATAQLENARAQAISLRSTRQQYESAIAVLLGKAPTLFTLSPTTFNLTMPSIPLSVPSALLLQRPDIYSAERSVAAANAEIGVAKAAWFPTLSLSASGGLQHSNFADWIAAPLNFWSLGPQLALSILDGGARRAAIATSEVNYRATVANYRQTVVTALKEVEDNLTLMSVLKDQDAVQQRALVAARESLKITRNQYQAGLVDYLSVSQVEQSTYNTEISALELKSQRLQAAVDLIMALGGGWSVPNPGTISTSLTTQ
ncbi:efflux transporter outer membrane subunit [Pelistega sp. MC2]|uniref:efflux transporter outer membrane subunit n=1 Tax=Pelistega sp. MC2 TaxID=1720297 RepID=UPI0008DA74FD|nr:efflux transporter outer membrane subunit [Pelistega sp. MC2]